MLQEVTIKKSKWTSDLLVFANGFQCLLGQFCSNHSLKQR